MLAKKKLLSGNKQSFGLPFVAALHDAWQLVAVLQLAAALRPAVVQQLAVQRLAVQRLAVQQLQQLLAAIAAPAAVAIAAG